MTRKKNPHRNSTPCAFLTKDSILDHALAAATTRDFQETISEAAQRDPVFRRRLLVRGFAMIHSADDEHRILGKRYLRHYICATIGFPELAKALDTTPQRLKRMLSDKGNPRLDSFAPLVDYLFTHEGICVRDLVEQP